MGQIVIALFIFSFILGLVGQSIVQKIEPHKPQEKTKLSKVLPWLIGVWYWKKEIMNNKNDEKMAIYREEMKKPLKFYTKHSECAKSVFLNTLIDENSMIDVEKIINAVMQGQADNDNIAGKRLKSNQKMFVCQKFINVGLGYDMRATAYPLLYVYFRKYIKGEFVEKNTLERALSLFGTIQEQEALKFETNQDFKRTIQKTRWIEHELKEKKNREKVV